MSNNFKKEIKKAIITPVKTQKNPKELKEQEEKSEIISTER